MRPFSFPKAVDGVLCLAGFRREGERLTSSSKWVRSSGDYDDEIGLQLSPFFDSITLNVWSRDRVTMGIVEQYKPPGWVRGLHHAIYFRPKRALVEGEAAVDWWPRNEPEGSAKMAQLIRSEVLPRLEALHSLDGMARYLEARLFSKRMWDERMCLAVTLCRLGKKDRAIEVIDEPMTAWMRRQPGAVQIEGVRRWIHAFPSD